MGSVAVNGSQDFSICVFPAHINYENANGPGYGKLPSSRHEVIFPASNKKSMNKAVQWCFKPKMPAIVYDLRFFNFWKFSWAKWCM